MRTDGCLWASSGKPILGKIAVLSISCPFKRGSHPSLPANPECKSSCGIWPRAGACHRLNAPGSQMKDDITAVVLCVTANDQKVFRKTSQALTGKKSQLLVKKFPAENTFPRGTTGSRPHVWNPWGQMCFRSFQNLGRWPAARSVCLLYRLANLWPGTKSGLRIVFINKVGLVHSTPICLYVVRGDFQVQWHCWAVRERVLTKPKILTIWPCTERLLSPGWRNTPGGSTF